MWWIAVNGSGGAPDLANDDLADYADHSAAKKTDMPRSSINTQWERRERASERLIRNYTKWKVTAVVVKKKYKTYRSVCLCKKPAKVSLFTLFDKKIYSLFLVRLKSHSIQFPKVRLKHGNNAVGSQITVHLSPRQPGPWPGSRTT